MKKKGMMSAFMSAFLTVGMAISIAIGANIALSSSAHAISSCSRWANTHPHQQWPSKKIYARTLVLCQNNSEYLDWTHGTMFWGGHKRGGSYYGRQHVKTINGRQTHDARIYFDCTQNYNDHGGQTVDFQISTWGNRSNGSRQYRNLGINRGWTPKCSWYRQRL